jgi:hypothetical protein
MPSLPPHGDGWSYDFRYGFGDSDSSDSETEPDGAGNPPLSHDARLLRALDISARPDAAVYKPTPWTIARVNAASRPAETRPVAEAPRKKAESPAKKKGALASAFERQRGSARKKASPLAYHTVH